MSAALGLALAATWPALLAADEPGANEPRAIAGSSGEAVQRLIGEAACKTDAECRTAPFGSKACGGPQRYLAWSTRQTDGQQLAAALARDAAQVKPPVAASNCAVVADPGARCATVGGDSPRCVLRGADEGGASDRR